LFLFILHQFNHTTTKTKMNRENKTLTLDTPSNNDSNQKQDDNELPLCLREIKYNHDHKIDPIIQKQLDDDFEKYGFNALSPYNF